MVHKGDLMKRLLILLLLLPALAWGGDIEIARMNPYILGGGASAAAVATDSCTGGLSLSWHFENNLDVTTGGVAGGVNNGCSAGDTTATATSGATFDGTAGLYKDGSYAGDYPTTGDYHSFTYTSIFNTDQGTVDLWVYCTTIETGTPIFYVYTDTNNTFKVTVISTQFQLTHIAGETVRIATTVISGDRQADTWYHVIAKWSIDKSGDGTNYLKICADTTTGTGGCGVNTNALGTWAGTPGDVRVGIAGNFTSDLHLDNLKVYTAWQ
jgi:hypothetical protein